MTGLNVNIAKSEMVTIGEVNNVHTLVEILSCRGLANDLFGYAVGGVP